MWLPTHEYQHSPSPSLSVSLRVYSDHLQQVHARPPCLPPRSTQQQQGEERVWAAPIHGRTTQEEPREGRFTHWRGCARTGPLTGLQRSAGSRQPLSSWRRALNSRPSRATYAKATKVYMSVPYCVHLLSYRHMNIHKSFWCMDRKTTILTAYLQCEVLSIVKECAESTRWRPLTAP